MLLCYLKLPWSWNNTVTSSVQVALPESVSQSLFFTRTYRIKTFVKNVVAWVNVIYLEIMIGLWFRWQQLVSCGYVRAVAVESEVLTIKGKVLWIAKAIANTVSAIARFNAHVIAIAYKPVRTDASWIAQVWKVRARLRVQFVEAGCFASLSIAFVEHGSARSAIDGTIVFRAPAVEISRRMGIMAFHRHDAHRLTCTTVCCDRCSRCWGLRWCHTIAHDFYAAENGLLNSWFILTVTLRQRLLSKMLHSVTS